MRRALAFLIAVALSWTTHADDHPNIVIILADDMGSGDPRCLNPESKIPTPALDRLAREGARFTDAHSPSGVCTPTRYGLLTGRYAWRTRMKSGVLNGYGRALIEPGRMTIASMLQEHGYDTAFVGKWHLGLGVFDPADPKAKTDYSRPFDAGPHTVGFATVYGIPASLDMAPYVYLEGDFIQEAATETVEKSGMRRGGGGGFWRGGPIASDFRHIDVLPRTGDRAVAFIEAVRDQPFFLYMPLSAPHTPWLPTPEFDGRSGAGPYGDFVAQVDHEVGRVLDALDRAGVAEDTLVIFTSDNGADWRPSDFEQYGHRGNAALRGRKADIHEGGHRVPFIARWPGNIEAGTTNDALIGLNDLYATIAGIVGHEIGAGEAEDAVDQSSALRGGPGARRDLVHHAMDGMFALRQGRWKLIDGRGSGGFTQPKRVKIEPGDPEGQLYDLVADPAETTNLWAERPEVVERLRARLAEIRGN